jgi:hypothetical protein
VYKRWGRPSRAPVLPGDGHLLAKSVPILWERLFEWLPDVLGVPLQR